MTYDIAGLRELMGKATSLPWSGQASDDYVIEAAAYPKEYGGRFKEDSTGFYLATVGNHPSDYGEANRDLIVAAVNSLPALLDRIDHLEKVLRVVVSGDVPRLVIDHWRKDKKPSKHDLCAHGVEMYADCSNCTADFIAATLNA